MGIILHHDSYLVEKADESKNLSIFFSTDNLCEARKSLGFNSLADDTIRNWQGYSYGGGSVDAESFSPQPLPTIPAGSYNMERGINGIRETSIHINISSNVVPVRFIFI